MRVCWTIRRTNQSILREINPQYSSEGLMLKLKFQYCSQLMQRTNSLENTLMLGKIEGERRREENNVLFSIIMNTNKIIPQPKVYNIDGNYHLLGRRQ